MLSSRSNSASMSSISFRQCSMSMIKLREIKNQPRLFRIAAGSLKVLCFLLGRQHIGFKLRRSALLKKEGAVGKGEVEVCASAIHNLGVL